ncbi:hypothetical protein TNCV_4751771 [Trichonephila clavipes]|nr:hypothetical protein TNCV_4751771 [Trichonephila clavipes]
MMIPATGEERLVKIQASPSFYCTFPASDSLATFALHLECSVCVRCGMNFRAGDRRSIGIVQPSAERAEVASLPCFRSLKRERCLQSFAGANRVF